jgi:hypothetical protein
MSILRFALITGLVAFFTPAAHPQSNPPVAADQPPVVSPPNWSGVSASLLGASKLGPELILNGDFENTSIIGCAFGLSNASFTAGMANATGFGTAEEIDVMVSPTGCSYLLAPTSGSVKIGVSSQFMGGLVDAFSLHLSEPLISGESYTLSFDAIAYAQDFAPDTGDVLIGVSTVPNAFGTLVYSATPPPINWQSFGTTFVAPNNGQYLTVQQVDSGDIWNHLDSFSLIAECPPSLVYCTPKLNSLGCSPTIFTTGTPSLSGTGPGFRIRAGSVLNQEVGLMFWGRAPASIPFAGGTLCVAPPLTRTAVQNSGGTSLPAMDCSGTYVFQFTPAMMNQAGLVVGDDVYSQYWSRDDGFPPPDNVGLTAGVHWSVCP